MIISHIETKHAGFFSSFFFMINHYIYAKINKQSFKLITEDWLFKYKKGWEDYFLPIDLCFDFSSMQIIKTKPEQDIIIKNHAAILRDVPWKIYRQIIIQDIYRYNSNTQNIINKSKNILAWNPKEYATIFIRRGDKLIAEAQFIPAEQYLIYLIELYPECNKVYLQTDDYNVFLELIDFKNKNSRFTHIDIQTFCKEEYKGGMIITKEKYEYCRNENVQENINTIPIVQNQEYIRENLESLQKCKPLEMQPPEYIYEHTLDMLIGIDMIFQGRFCVTDYQSNITRFVKLGHPDIDSVYDIIRRSNIINLYNTICPGWNCSFYM
jgi:hypothetical protein